MDICNLQTSLHYLTTSGTTITTEKKVTLYNSLTLLQNDNHFRQVLLWGRISAVENDYYISFGYEKDILFGKVFYYSTDCINWGLLPKPTKSSIYLTLMTPMIFQGDPALRLTISKEGFEGFNEDFDLPEDENNDLKEENRLSSVVHLINEEAALVPRGALFKRPDGYIVKNLAFEGITENESTLLKSYLHYRPPHEKWNINLLTRPNYNFALDFLDAVETDIPRGCCWSLHLAMGGHVVILRSLLWHGMTFYHQICTPEHGFLYIGNGKRNIDLPFMI